MNELPPDELAAIPILLEPVREDEPAAPAAAADTRAAQQSLFDELPPAAPPPGRQPRRPMAQVRAEALAELQRRAPTLVERVLADHEQLLRDRLRSLLLAELAQILRESGES